MAMLMKHRELALGMENIHGEAIRQEGLPVIGELDVSDPKYTFSQQPTQSTFSPIGRTTRHCYLQS